MGYKRIAAGVGLLAAAVAVAEVNKRVFPHGSYVIVVLVLLWAGCTLVARGWRSLDDSGEARPQRVRPLQKQVRPLKTGESYDRPVKLALVPNAPMAEVWQQRLRQEGIEAFFNGSLLRTPSLPVTLWVGEHDLDRARELFPELR
jgi:hypothetical protein